MNPRVVHLKKMAGLWNILQYSFLIILSLNTITTQSVMGSPPPLPAVKGAYWPSWTNSKLPPSAIDTSLFTHIYYAFLGPSNVTYKFEVSDSTATLLSNFTTALRQKNPTVKTLISFGGADGNPQLFARIASDSESRKTFINSAIDVARKFGFDGLDLDWESPKDPKEMKDLAQLLQQWRKAIRKEADATGRPPLLLTAAVYFAVNFFVDAVYRSYPVDSINQNLDWINAMCYDYHGGWDPLATGAQAALYAQNSNVSTSYGLRSWIHAGVPPHKVVMGLPLYGRTWTLKDPNSHDIGSPAVAVGPGDQGILSYSEVLEFNKKQNGTVVYDLDSVSTYSFAGSTWIGYDDLTSTTVKIGFAQALGLRGYFFWALGSDSNWEISNHASRAWILGG